MAPHRTGRRRAVAALSVVILWAAAGCGDGGSDDSGASDGARTPATGVTGSPSDPGSPSASLPESPSASSGVPAATGAELSLGQISVRVPDGFTPSEAMFDEVSKQAQSHEGLISVTAIEVPNDSFEGLTYEQAVKVFRESEPDARVLDPVEVQGVKMIHAQNKTEFDVQTFFQVTREKHVVSLNFFLSRDLADGERQEIIDSVLATLTWP